MEIELKLRLFSPQSYQEVLDYFNSLSSSSSNLRSGSLSNSSDEAESVEVKSPERSTTDIVSATKKPKQVEQLNVFLDIELPNEKKYLLESNKTVLRFRTCAEVLQETRESKETEKENANNLKINEKKYAVVTVKSNSVLVDGVQTVEEEEQPIPLDVVASLMKLPSTTLLSLESSKKYRVIDLITTRFPSSRNDYSRWTILGSYKTLRTKFQWEGVTVEVDKTEFHFDQTAYEIEIEADKELIPEIKRKMIRILNDIGVEFGESKRNKFMNMRVGRID